MLKDQMVTGARVLVSGNATVHTLQRPGTKGGNSGWYAESGLFFRDDQLDKLTLQDASQPTDTRYRGDANDPANPTDTRYRGGQPNDPAYTGDPRNPGGQPLPGDTSYPGYPNAPYPGAGAPDPALPGGPYRGDAVNDPRLNRLASDPRDPQARGTLADDLNVGRPADPLFVDDSRREARRMRQLTREQDRVGERQDIDDDERVRVEEALGRGDGRRGMREGVARLSAEVTRLSAQVDRLTGSPTNQPGVTPVGIGNPAYPGSFPAGPGGPYPAGPNTGPYPGTGPYSGPATAGGSYAGMGGSYTVGTHPGSQAGYGTNPGNPSTAYPAGQPQSGWAPGTAQPASGWQPGTAGRDMGRSVGGVTVEMARAAAITELRTQNATAVRAGLVADGWSGAELEYILNG